MKISEHANYLLNEYGRLQFDYAAYCKPYGESLRNEARNNLEEYIAELEDAQRWVPVSERLPKENAPVLVLTVLGGMFVDFIHGKSVVTGNPDFYELDIEDVTHWMSLPTPPEVK